jgi:hypothetical protein
MIKYIRNGQVNDVPETEKVELKTQLQLEVWPFDV